MSTIVVMYHKNCNDGYVSALNAYSYYSERSMLDDVHFMPIQYGDPLPEEEVIEGKEVFIVDFSFSKENTAKIVELAGTVTMIDHHQTAINTLFTGEGFLENQQVSKDEEAGTYLLNTKTAYIKIDNNESGASLSYNLWGSKVEDLDIRERLLYLSNHAKDRDLWIFSLPNTNALYEYSSTMKFDLEIGYDELVCSHDFVLADQIEIAAVRVEMRNELSKSYASKAATVMFMGIEIPMVNTPTDFSSLVGEILSKDKPFALMYTVGVDKVYCSLRSSKGIGVDVEAVAKAFGGGGHKNASGFTIPVENLVDLVKGRLDPSMCLVK